MLFRSAFGHRREFQAGPTTTPVPGGIAYRPQHRPIRGSLLRIGFERIYLMVLRLQHHPTPENRCRNRNVRGRFPRTAGRVFHGAAERRGPAEAVSQATPKMFELMAKIERTHVNEEADCSAI